MSCNINIFTVELRCGDNGYIKVHHCNLHEGKTFGIFACVKTFTVLQRGSCVAVIFSVIVIFANKRPAVKMLCFCLLNQK